MKCCDSLSQCIDCPTRPAAVAPIKLQRRSCDALGVCQSRTTACAGCTTHEQAATKADLTRLNELPTSRWDRFWFYGTVSIASACTLAMVCGASGWVYVRLFS